MIRITLAALLGIYSINFAQADISSIIGDTVAAAKTAASTVKDSATSLLNTAKTKAVKSAAERVRTSISNIQTEVQAQLQTAKNSANAQATDALTKANESYNEALNNLDQLEATLQQKTTANVATTKKTIQEFASSINSNLTSAKTCIEGAHVSALNKGASSASHLAHILDKAATKLAEATK